MTRFDNLLLRDLAHALQLEWLETDGLGGFAMGTVVGANTRRYHGLLVAATQPPVGRRVLVAKVEDRLQTGASLCDLSCNVYRDAVHPNGHERQREFRLDPWPVFTWSDCGCTLQKSVFMPYKLGITVIRYDLLQAPESVWLHARPLLAGRDMHHLQLANNELNDLVSMPLHTAVIQPYDAPSKMSLYFPEGDFRLDSLWYYNFRYFREEESGLDYLEDLYSPGEISWLMREGDTRWLVLGTQTPSEFDGEQLMVDERRRRDAILSSFGE
ncbi:MAG: glycogen debranching enzyme N-terminal domain-containing protein, partial [Armatimonadia bacterium]